MDQSFDLPLTYKSKELLFTARLLQQGYSHKFGVAVNDQEIFLNRMKTGLTEQLLTLPGKKPAER
jgi:hypothetical protein